MQSLQYEVITPFQNKEHFCDRTGCGRKHKAEKTILFQAAQSSFHQKYQIVSLLWETRELKSRAKLKKNFK